MKKCTHKIVALLLAVVMVVSNITPTAFAAVDTKSSNAAAKEEIVLSDNTKTILEAAKAMASINKLAEEDEEASAEKEAVKDGIFHNYDDETDLAGYGISSEEMDEIVEEVLDENHMESTVEVTYETDANDNVTSMSVEMDALVSMAGEEAAGLTAEQQEELMGAYSQYMSYMQANADLFGVQTPYFTNKDNACPVGSLLAIAGIPNEYLALGIDFVVQNIMSFDEVKGVVDLFHYANVFTVELKKAELEAARDEALNAVSGAKTDVQKHLQLTNWLAQNCTFDMPYIMEMTAPEVDTESKMYTDKMTIYNIMYEDIKGQVYDGYYQYLLYQEGYPEETAAQVAEMMAKSYMDDPTQDGSQNGSESAMVLASSIINLWEGSHVGALTYGTAVCLGYSNAYTYLIQYLYSNVYKNSDGSWKTYDQLNSGSNGNWNAIVDYVRITFDAEVTMFGVTQESFQSDHYWNAVKIDNKWYYVDPCYVDVYVEVMARDRVETNGNVNHLYFLFSDDTARDLYEDYYKELDTLYQGIATETKYEDAWFAFAKSPIYKNSNTYYYVYDSTDMIELQNSNTEFSQDDIEYKIVSKSVASSNSNDASADYTTELINFTNGTVYNPSSKEMVENPIIKKYYDEFETYKEDYPSLVISVAFYNNKLYFNMSNCIFSYDISSGDVARLVEYNTVTAERDMTVAFGGMSFTAADSEGDYGITVKNPPIAGLTIRDGQMTVDIATTLGYISGKKSHTDSDDEPEDGSSYGYMFEETNYNPEYMYASFSDMGSMMGDTDNDNDEFMWSANIYETIDMSHLTSRHSSYSNVTVEGTCTNDSYTEKRCSTCGLIQEAGTSTTTIKIAVVDADGNAIEGVTVSDTVTVESTQEDYISSSFKASDVQKAAEKALGDEYTVLAVEMPETIAWGETKTANVVVEAVQKDTPVTVTVEGTSVTVDAVTVTSTKAGLEEAAEAAAKAAVEAKIDAEEFTISSVDATSLNWGSSAAVKVTVTANEKETPVTVKVVGAEIADQTITVKSTKAGFEAAAKEAAEEAAKAKFDTNTYSYTVESVVASDLTWGTAGTVTVTVGLTENSKATAVKVNVVDDKGAAVALSVAGDLSVTTTKAGLEAAAEAKAEEAVKAAITDGAYEFVSAEAGTTDNWGTEIAVTVTVKAVEKETKVKVAITGENGTDVSSKVAADLSVTTTKAGLETAVKSKAEEAVKAAITDGVYEIESVTAETGAADKWGAEVTVTVKVKEAEKETSITVKVIGAEIADKTIKVTATKAGFEAKAKADAQSEVEKQIDAETYDYTVGSVVATDLVWGTGGTITVTVALTEKTKETKVKVDVVDEAGTKVDLTVTVDPVTTTKANLAAAAKAAADTAANTAITANGEYEYVSSEAGSSDGWGTEITVTVKVKAVTKATTVKVNVMDGEGTAVALAVEDLSVTAAKAGLEAAAEKAAAEAVTAAITENAYEVVSAEAETGVTDKWGTTVTVTVTVVVPGTATVNEDAPTALAEGDATATLKITISGQSDQPSALTATGESGKVHVFTADEIKSAVNEVLEDGNEIAITTIISDRAVKYGATKTITVTLKSTEASHQYVEFKEKYYTKSGNDWMTATCYVCINCKDAVEDKPSSVLSVNKNNLTKVWTWRGDYSTASVYRIPTELKDIKLDCVYENPSVGSSREIASSITKTMEGTCDEGVTYVYTATAGSDTDVKRDKQAAAAHQYVASEIQYAWAEDLSKCDISYKCSFCGKAGAYTCEGENLKIDYVEPTCIVDGKTIYTASVTLEGNVYSDSREIFNENKALGHNYAYDETAGDEICSRCQQVKPDSKITLPANYRGVYTGEAVKDLENLYTVEGSHGKVTFTYYTDKACTKKTAKKAHGAAKSGQAPSEMGIYYVKAKVAADDDYKTATSGVCKFILGPSPVKSLKKSNVQSGVKLSWKKVSEATGYEIYRRSPSGSYEKVQTIKKNTTLEWTDKNVKAGETYVYDVRTYAKTDAGTVRCATNADGASIVRSEITAGTVSNGVKVRWTKIAKAETYKVYRKAVDTESKYTLLATVDADKTYYTDKKAKNGVKYYYYVKPNNAAASHTVAKIFLTQGKVSSVKAPAAKQLKVTWKKNAKADGYRIRYSTSESFKSYKTITVKSNKTLTTTIKSLKKNTKYYVKVQSYKKNSGKTYYSAWSDVSTKKTKK